MVPVRQAGAEVAATFWAKLAGHRGGWLDFTIAFPFRGSGLVKMVLPLAARRFADSPATPNTASAFGHYAPRWPLPSSARSARQAFCPVWFPYRSGSVAAACSAAWRSGSPRPETPTLGIYG